MSLVESCGGHARPGKTQAAKGCMSRTPDRHNLQMQNGQTNLIPNSDTNNQSTRSATHPAILKSNE